jgi:hypothetical protein
MRNISGILLMLALLGVFMLPGLNNTPAEPLLTATNSATPGLGSLPKVTGTPRAVFPLIRIPNTNTPTNTPTRTPTRTNTPLATATRTGVPGTTGLQGRVVMQKARYFAITEWIFFFEQLYNPTGSPKPYTLLGVNVTGPIFPGNNPRFHTSWTGAPDYVLSGCWGPNGSTDWNLGPNYRCAPNQNEGWHEDHIGASSNLEITTPGHYWVEFWACLSSHFQCTTAGQSPTWIKLGDAQFDADPPTAAALAADDATPMPQTTCALITDDPDNIHLDCKR